MSEIFGIYLAGICSAVLCTALLTPLVRLWALRQGLVDQPGARKVHTKPIARLGGIAIFLGYMISVGVSLVLARVFYDDFSMERQGLVILLVGGAVFAIGILDDLYALSGKLKFLVLIVGASVLCKSGIVITTVSIGSLGVEFQLGYWAWPITILWVLMVTVSINFMDGLDGLAGGIVAIAAATLAFWLAQLFTLNLTLMFAGALFGSLLGFLVHNRHPASIFMGDGGSMFIGFTIASLTVLSNQNGQLFTMQALALPALALSVPLTDLAFTVIRRRFIQRRSIFSAERGHIHHQLLEMGLKHPHAVLVIHGVTLAAVGFGSMGVLIGGKIGLVMLLFVIPLVGGLFRASGSARARQTLRAISHAVKIDREAKDYQAVFDEMQLRFNRVADFDQWWAQVVDTAEQLDFVKLDLELARRDGTPRNLSWVRSSGAMDECTALEISIPIQQRRADDSLMVQARVAAPTSLESAGRRVALFARLMEDHSLRGLARSPKASADSSASLSSVSIARCVDSAAEAQPSVEGTAS